MARSLKIIIPALLSIAESASLQILSKVLINPSGSVLSNVRSMVWDVKLLFSLHRMASSWALDNIGCERLSLFA